MDPRFYKKRKKERLFDRLHKGVVSVCMGVTVIGTLMIGYKVYEYFRYVRPLQQVQSKLMEDELLLEGRNIEDTSENLS
ncbi:hypothetical protein ALC56_14687 [Trachymyrmex septentrionalis]|uniref:Uncharacterized protein n=1 Tax=Trachymyrmex septentrionalis TaxID=34720 RepID=A0A195ERJ3_9HYME|nr:PREDICTED: uncharacterized protein LOC108755688 [Trachymyrmex septentrionalis]KYN30875.1 hypothetical protein ALC56_14687 [Trachymyrmex septentrionalis]